MPLTLELSHFLAVRLKAEAARLGIPPEEIAIDALDAHLSRLRRESASPTPAGGPTVIPQVSDEEWEAALADFERLTEDSPGADIPEEMLRREHMYEDRL